MEIICIIQESIGTTQNPNNYRRNNIIMVLFLLLTLTSTVGFGAFGYIIIIALHGCELLERSFTIFTSIQNNNIVTRLY